MQLLLTLCMKSINLGYTDSTALKKVYAWYEKLISGSIYDKLNFPT
ncbi:hypothetical protein EDD69_11913 [Thermolongibacillus altinsuensis]|uniref:Uncharacterized protein n=1 Tax=Thermolongibacillus altinsuensis TaxID=575256 RepID=A0A4R1QIZ7_9BACL|nr:hypothetical protein EDD69_11913 [Thermolongibacillus altinsuensis]